MSGRYFLDTNILVYTFDGSAPEKRKRASALVKLALGDGSGLISTQVVQEFLNLALRRFSAPLTPAEAERYLNEVLVPLCEVFPDATLYKSALDVHSRWGFSFYDALIVAAALRSQCTTLYTEDLQDGQRIRDLVIRNPFAA